MANFDRLGWLLDAPFSGDRGASMGTRGNAGIIARADFRLWSDWYEVVIAVVAVGPLAIGVRYSVRDSGSSFTGDLVVFTVGIHGP
jgi:hypothetical protein